jgi:hypothetical protein
MSSEGWESRLEKTWRWMSLWSGFVPFAHRPTTGFLAHRSRGVSRTCSTLTVPPTETSNQKHTPNMAIRSVMQA